MLVLLLLFKAYLSLANGFNLDLVTVLCDGSIACEQRTTKFQSLVGEYRSLVHLKETLKLLASDGGYQNFSFDLENLDSKHVLKISFVLKPIINKIKISFVDRHLDYDPMQLVSLREGDFFEIQKVKESLEGLNQRLDSMGFPNNSHDFQVVYDSGKVDIKIRVTLGQPRIFKSINTNASSSFVEQFLKRKFLNLYNRPFDVNNFKIYLDDAQRELFNFGYYLIGLDFTPVYKGYRVILDIKVTHDQLYAFDFKNLQREHRDIIHSLIVNLFRKFKRPITESVLTQTIKEHYYKKALLNAEVRVESSTFRNKSNEQVHLFRIFFDENGKTRLAKVRFSGNNFFKTKRLERMFRKEAFELASLHYFDDEYFTYFQDFLKNQYIRKGFVQAKVFDPVKSIDSDKKISSIDYTIQEGRQAFVKTITFNQVPPDYQDTLLARLSNKIGSPFNPIEMMEDVKKITNELQNRGHYYAEVINTNDPAMVRYNKTGTDVDINYQIKLGPIVQLNRILFMGNDKTRKRVLEKKVRLQKGSIISPAITKDIESALMATGLFNSVTVIPVKHNSKNAATDLLVKVSERDYGLVEIAPGYRTDLGLKLTGTVSYQNVAGANRSISLRSQLNRRTSYTTIDPKRRDNIEHILEHNNSLNYIQGDIFDTLIDGAASVAYQTRRFYAFDANIFRINGTLSRDLSKRLTTSLRYQYEDIKQYSATEEINNGSFQIGAIIPSLTYDLRNSQTNPLRGAFFNLSCEFANPYFLSQKEPDLTVNYYKLVSRNRFYVPFKNGTVAISAVAGIQENFATEKVTYNGTEQTEGYLPTIKVFRLTGMDIIRGYSDREMNRLPTGKDISDVRVDQKAYMANFKIEPRYFLNDSLMAGVFYDAGRIFVNSMDLGDLRDSVGVTFKVVTPVGTLDFDYGIKLLRKKTPGGSLEDPGRFHVSIGFF
jgi:outer membrane protein insertion porin family